MKSSKFVLHMVLFVLMLVGIGALLVVNVSAQDVGTDEPLPVDSDIPVVMVDQGGTDWALVGVLFGAIVTVGVIVVVAIRMAAKGIPPEQIDAETTRRLQEYQRDRVTMDRLEKAYQEAGSAYKTALNTVAGTVALLAPFLQKFGTDDAIAALIKDIQTPGAPAETVTSGNAANDAPAALG